ncbi:ABC transporter permease [Parasporobacterium paucivorans]|uniref:Putative ABC transport system permease protein n=1 Tax=Parasporobacterium paucivorans DSM 15970 TaxID=1122934 RepID=A0A1M6LIS0_9FIRM|nr:ABC transporter permease [Parasporobacterium paucivorans]SHJ71086.1 putative ABC transport system permease protein [Parasporobacterium paucivorans DSM 15970]
MYILKNALRSISRSKGRNILVGIIVLVIAVSTCVGLSIRQAAVEAKASALDSLEVTAQISVDRQSMMKNLTTENGETDREAMKAAFSSVPNLTIEDMLVYAGADSVKNFYYTLSTSLDGSDSIAAIDTSSSTTESSADPAGFDGAFKGGGTQGDFTVIGYSGESAMTDFTDGTSTITEGTVFKEGTTDNVCIISDELAQYNSLSVGDSFTLVNPNNSGETVALTIVGIYNNSNSTVVSSDSMGGFSASTDPANEIYMSYAALKAITTASAASAATTTDTDGNTTGSTALREQESGIYVFSDVASYEKFDSEARALGLADTYIISSSDLASYEQSLQPLENLSSFATYFLLVVLLVGAIVLVVFNIFNIRERKYEIGVLTAIGMKKSKVALQFISELFIVTFISIIIGTGIGAGISLPVTNSLLASQVSVQEEQAASQESNFGRSKDAGNALPAMGGTAANTIEYVTEVSSATDFVVIFQLLGIGILLTFISSGAAVITVLRYEPLKILTNRD